MDESKKMDDDIHLGHGLYVRRVSPNPEHKVRMYDDAFMTIRRAMEALKKLEKREGLLVMAMKDEYDEMMRAYNKFAVNYWS